VQELTKKILELQSTSQMPGLQIAVTEGNEVIFECTHGIRAYGYSEAITSQDQWHIGSCTKPMTAFLIARLIDEKALDWNSRLEDIVQRIAQPDVTLHPSVKSITIEQLLSHKSGLVDVTDADNGKLWLSLFTDKKRPHLLRDQLVREILKMPTRFQPGNQIEYSNSGYVVLGWIIEILKSKTWESAIQKDLFQRFDMNSCGFGPAGIEDTRKPLHPWAHQLTDDGLVAIPPGVHADNPAALVPAGSVHCNVKDWRKFLNLFINHQGVESGFLTSATYSRLLSQAGADATTYNSMVRLQPEP